MEEIGKTEETQSAPVVATAIRAMGVMGDLRLIEFRSRIFRNTRFLRVWLPPGYDDLENAERHYPALYLNDGQNLFESSTSFTGVEWQADETADRLIRESSIAPMIIVGVDNAGKDRIREYMPHRSLNPMIVRALGRHYPDFLIKEVMPFVCRNFRVAKDAGNIGLGGSSMGALIALHTAIARPGVIGKLLLESPSLWASNRQLIRESLRVRIWPERVFLGVGTAEAGSPERSRATVDDVRELAAILRRAGLSEKRLRLVIDENAGHNEGAWAARFPQALQFLFGQ
jgi:predicted alpha/beta superfamily hydrolase